MVDVHRAVKAVRQLSVRGKTDLALAGARGRVESSSSHEVGVRMFPLADRDAARQRALVVVDAIVGDFQVMGPSVHQDAAAALGTVDDRQAVNSRWVAIKVAGQRTATIRGAHVAVGEKHAV